MLSELMKGLAIAFLITAFAVGVVDGKTVTYTKNITLNTEVQNFTRDQYILLDTPEYVANRFSQDIDRGGAGGMANFEIGYESQEEFFSLVREKRNIIDTVMCDDEIITEWNPNLGNLPYGLKRTFYAFNFTDPGLIVVYSEVYPFPEFEQGITCEVVQINATIITYKYQAEVGAGFSLRDILS